MVQSSPAMHHQFGPKSSAQVTARRHVKMHLRKIREREYSRLRELIPSVSTRSGVSKVTVVEEAVRYIEDLHRQLMDRLRSTHGDKAEDKAQETIQHFMRQMTPRTCTTLASTSTRMSSPNVPFSSLTRPNQQLSSPLRSPDGSLLMRFTSADYAKHKTQASFSLLKTRKD